jgi:nucleotide-binding universal stress UspA family protein
MRIGDGKMKIMVAFDGSIHSQKALEHAKTYSQKFNSDIWIVTSMAAEDSTAHLFQSEINSALDLLKCIKKEMDDFDFSVQTHLSLRGLEPGEDLVNFASENNINVIFIGLRKRSKVGKLLLGSVAQYILLCANCPVFAAK